NHMAVFPLNVANAAIINAKPMRIRNVRSLVAHSSMFRYGTSLVFLRLLAVTFGFSILSATTFRGKNVCKFILQCYLNVKYFKLVRLLSIMIILTIKSWTDKCFFTEEPA